FVGDQLLFDLLKGQLVGLREVGPEPLVQEADDGGQTLRHRLVLPACAHLGRALQSLRYARSGVQDKAVLYLERAGDHALAQRAHAAAEGYYQDVVTRLDGLGRARSWARCYSPWDATTRRWRNWNGRRR